MSKPPSRSKRGDSHVMRFPQAFTISTRHSKRTIRTARSFESFQWKLRQQFLLESYYYFFLPYTNIKNFMYRLHFITPSLHCTSACHSSQRFVAPTFHEALDMLCDVFYFYNNSWMQFIFITWENGLPPSYQQLQRMDGIRLNLGRCSVHAHVRLQARSVTSNVQPCGRSRRRASIKW